MEKLWKTKKTSNCPNINKWSGPTALASLRQICLLAVPRINYPSYIKWSCCGLVSARLGSAPNSGLRCERGSGSSPICRESFVNKKCATSVVKNSNICGRSVVGQLDRISQSTHLHDKRCRKPIDSRNQHDRCIQDLCMQ